MRLLLRGFLIILLSTNILLGTADARIVFQSEFFSEQQNNSFIVDAYSDVTGNLNIQFGNTIGAFLTWDISNNSFVFSKDLGVDGNTMTLDHDNTGGDITVKFGRTLAEYLKWNASTLAFDLSDNLNLTGNQIQNVRFENKATDPATCIAGLAGRVYFNTTDKLTYVCNGTVWKSTGGLGTDLPAVQARRTSDLSIGSINTWTDVTMNITDIKNNPAILNHSTSVNSDNITIGETGVYQVFYRANHRDASVTHEMDTRVRINDTTVIPGSLVNSRDFRDEYSPVANSVLVTLNAGDFITLQAQRITAATLVSEVSFSAIRLRGEKGDQGTPGTSVLTGSTPPVTCVAPKGGTLWYDTDLGLTYVCDTSNGRNKWLSQTDIPMIGEENGSCGSGKDVGDDGDCSVAFGDSLGGDGNTTSLGYYIPYPITIVGYGFSQDDDGCTSGSFDLEVWGTGSSTNDNDFTLKAEIATGLVDETAVGTNKNINVAGGQYILWGVDNNCGQSIDDWNLVLYYRNQGT